MAEQRGYPIGMQDFVAIRESGAVYVDKSEYVYNMAHSFGAYFFLSRPRRFGKSLLVSTLKAFFEGRKELFAGLRAGELETEWTEYPVIRLDLSGVKSYELERIEASISQLLNTYEKIYNLELKNDINFGVRLSAIIHAAYEQTGRKVVILIDEYDAPVMDSVSNPELQEQVRNRVRDLYSPLKKENDYLRFVFLTGISKFSQLSIFSELNNLRNITFDPAYEGICGITEEELLTQMQPDIERLKESMSQYKPTTFDDAVAQLKMMYDGYHFADKMTDIYNPWSLINAFQIGKIQNFWIPNGTPTMLTYLFSTKEIRMPQLEGLSTSLTRFDAHTERIDDPVPLLFQSGYLTLKGYDPYLDEYTLGFPNKEVRDGFALYLYKHYTPAPVGNEDWVISAFKKLRRQMITLEQFIDTLARWYHSIPYSVTDHNRNEQFYQALLYALLNAAGADVRAEQQTSDGRLDIALLLPYAILILEFKYDGDVDEAMGQMRSKGYADAYAGETRPISLVAINIDSQRRTIDEYRVEAL